MSDLFTVAAGVLLSLMLIMNAVNIVFRNAGLGGLLWVAPWSGVMITWAVFLAFYVMYRRQLDIALTVFVDLGGPLTRMASRILTALVGLAVMGTLLTVAPQIFARQRGTMEIVGLTRYWLSVPLVASSAMLVLHFIVDAITLIGGWGDDDSAGREGATEWSH